MQEVSSHTINSARPGPILYILQDAQQRVEVGKANTWTATLAVPEVI
jgi:hypothetical protein